MLPTYIMGIQSGAYRMGLALWGLQSRRLLSRGLHGKGLGTVSGLRELAEHLHGAYIQGGLRHGCLQSGGAHDRPRTAANGLIELSDH